jgi:hypothetical protein
MHGLTRAALVLATIDGTVWSSKHSKRGGGVETRADSPHECSPIIVVHSTSRGPTTTVPHERSSRGRCVDDARRCDDARRRRRLQESWP